MKTIVLMITCGVILISGLAGQIHIDHDLFHGHKYYSPVLTPHFDYRADSELLKKFRLPDDLIINHDFDLLEKHFNKDLPSRKDFSDKFLADRFPGHDKYYSKMPSLYNHFEKSFIKKPDTTARYYLIIKNPLK